MRVELELEGGKASAGIYVHQRLPEAMGNSVAGFVAAVLGGGTAPGVWYPEEREALAVSVFSGSGFRGAACCVCFCVCAAQVPARRSAGGGDVIPSPARRPLLTTTHPLQQKNQQTQDRRAFLAFASQGCDRFDLNRPPWALESDVRQLGGLIYW